VDPDQLARELGAFTDVGTAMTEVRLRIAAVRADAPRWAADDDLPAAVDGLLGVLDEAAARSQLDARDLADALRAAAGGYSQADRSTTRPSREG
jgi:hypothetical protein